MEKISVNVLNPKQKAFADAYLKTGNAYRSALSAGYSESYAKGQANRVLENEAVQEYIHEKTLEAEARAGYKIEHVIDKIYEKALGLQYTKPYRELDMLTGELTVNKVQYLVPSDKDQLMAADMLLRMSGRYVDKQQIEHLASVKFVDDINLSSDENETD